MSGKTGETIICYLCGEELTGETNQDHVPPKQFYPEEYRKEKNYDKLVTLPVHKKCNKSYQRDEDYFYNTLLPLCHRSNAGKRLLEKAGRVYSEGKNVPLMNMVLSEFDPTPSGITLPPGLVKKKIDSERVQRISWKIVRGLYFKEYGQILPEDIENALYIFTPESKMPGWVVDSLSGTRRFGIDHAVFVYWYRYFPNFKNYNLWDMLLWEDLLLITLFKYP